MQHSCVLQHRAPLAAPSAAPTAPAAPACAAPAAAAAWVELAAHHCALVLDAAASILLGLTSLTQQAHLGVSAVVLLPGRPKSSVLRPAQWGTESTPPAVRVVQQGSRPRLCAAAYLRGPHVLHASAVLPT